MSDVLVSNEQPSAYNTFAMISKGAEAILYYATDASVPTGHWICLAVVGGVRRTYLLRGKMTSAQSLIVGRVEHTRYGLMAYRHDRILGGTFMGEASTEREALTLLVN